MNKQIIDQFEKLVKFIQQTIDKGDTKINKFRLMQIKKSLQTIKKYPKEIKDNLDEFRQLPTIGKGTIERIKEIIETKKLSELKDFKENKNDSIVDELETIVGIGHTTALDFVKKGIISIKDLKQKIKEKKIKVNDKILLGIKYHNKFFGNIPRNEITKIKKILTDTFKKINKEYKLNKTNEYFFTICGSYRRGQPTSNDIDVLISKKNDNDIDNNLEIFINKLKENKLLIDDITDKNFKTKYMGFAKYKNNPIRRIDIRYIPYESYYPALLYFTGSAELNKKMRRIAKTKKLKLSEYGLYKSNGTKIEINSENDIFKNLDIPFLDVKLR
jgi:DNA polymerase beta